MNGFICSNHADLCWQRPTVAMVVDEVLSSSQDGKRSEPRDMHLNQLSEIVCGGKQQCYSHPAQRLPLNLENPTAVAVRAVDKTEKGNT